MQSLFNPLNSKSVLKILSLFGQQSGYRLMRSMTSSQRTDLRQPIDYHFNSLLTNKRDSAPNLPHIRCYEDIFECLKAEDNSLIRTLDVCQWVQDIDNREIDISTNNLKSTLLSTKYFTTETIDHFLNVKYENMGPLDVLSHDFCITDDLKYCEELVTNCELINDLVISMNRNFESKIRNEDDVVVYCRTILKHLKFGIYDKKTKCPVNEEIKKINLKFNIIEDQITNEMSGRPDIVVKHNSGLIGVVFELKSLHIGDRLALTNKSFAQLVGGLVACVSHNHQLLSQLKISKEYQIPIYAILVTSNIWHFYSANVSKCYLTALSSRQLNTLNTDRSSSDPTLVINYWQKKSGLDWNDLNQRRIILTNLLYIRDITRKTFNIFNNNLSHI
ncbi:uncharacterized protein LOC128964883 [Oppia nitens]|uniref:uncharacterized protein LOC128964883 n=1 Tax=Oppia nitens TaxID=1686743 RepID=UPI0023DCA619|nr:uncharacterized protein LOC128964883 [Oppia nitens]